MLETLNFVHGSAVRSLSLVMSECSLCGHGHGHVSNFYIVDLEILPQQVVGRQVIYTTRPSSVCLWHGWHLSRSVHMFIRHRPTLTPNFITSTYRTALLRGNWQDFNWHDASRSPSAIAELFVFFRTGSMDSPDWSRAFGSVFKILELDLKISADMNQLFPFKLYAEHENWAHPKSRFQNGFVCHSTCHSLWCCHCRVGIKGIRNPVVNEERTVPGHWLVLGVLTLMVGWQEGHLAHKTDTAFCKGSLLEQVNV